MSLERIITIFLVLATTVAGLLYQRESNRHFNLLEDQDRNKPFVKMEQLFTDQRTVLWPSITGEYPRFITEGGMKGLGWMPGRSPTRFDSMTASSD